METETQNIGKGILNPIPFRYVPGHKKYYSSRKDDTGSFVAEKMTNHEFGLTTGFDKDFERPGYRVVIGVGGMPFWLPRLIFEQMFEEAKWISRKDGSLISFKESLKEVPEKTIVQLKESGFEVE